MALENGRLVLKRFTDLTKGRELVANDISQTNSCRQQSPTQKCATVQLVAGG